MERVRSVASIRPHVKSFSPNHSFIRLALFIVCLTGSGALVTAQNSNDRGTPADSKIGQSGPSTYARDKIETTNLANGNLSLSIPLATIGGRGSASFTIALSYNSKIWSVQSDGNGMMTNGGAQGVFRNIYSAIYDKLRPEEYEPYMLKLGGGWSIVTAPGVKLLTFGIDPLRSGCNHTTDDQPDCGFRYALTKMWVTLPDGSQVELRDVATQGAPSLTTHIAGGYHYLKDRDRGRIWRSVDGSNVIFVRDAGYPVGQIGGQNEFPSGWVFLSDGTRIRMDQGVAKKIIDRNGNFITLEGGTYTDQLGRQTILTTAPLKVTVKGYQGSPDRSLTIDSGVIGDLANLRADFHSLPRPFTTGDAFRDEQDNFDDHTIDASHTDLFEKSEGIRAYGTSEGFDVSTATAVTRLNLLDGRALRFRYNQYGEVAEIIYPGGGVSQIDYNGGNFGNCEVRGTVFGVYRAVNQRRILKANGSVEATWNYIPDAEWIDGVYRPAVRVEAYGASGELVSNERHFFRMLNAEYRPCAGPYTGTGNEKWENAKEFRTEIYTGTGMTVTTREWQQRAPVAWVADVNLGYNTYLNQHGQDQPANDTRIAWEETTLEDGKVKRVEYGYDQFNNVTSIKEYDFGTAGAPGVLLRETVRNYGANIAGNYGISINGYCYSNLDPTDSSCGAGLASDVRTIIYQPGLLLSETVKDGFGNQKSFTDFEYDNYAPSGNRPSMTINSGMIQYDATQFAPFSTVIQPRGNLTKVTRWLNGGTDVVASNQYDNAGQVVWTKNPNGNVATVSYVDNFGPGTSPDTGVSGPSGATYAFPTAAVNALGYQTRMQYDYSLGALTGSKDPNGVIAKTEYDGLGRPFRSIAALGLSEQSISEMIYPTAQENSSRISRQLDATRWVTSKTDFDGFDRPVTSWQSEDGQSISLANFTIRSDTVFDGIGRVKKVSKPYRPATETAAYTTTAFDLGGRVISVTTPDNAVVTNSYYSNRVLVRDQAGRKRISATDALGRLTDVWEITAADSATEAVTFPGDAEVADGYHTIHQYDTLDNLIEVTQGNQPHRSFVYDSLKRLISASNPESGTVNYQYDENGNLKVKSEARGVSAHYEYDALNRVSRRWYNGSSAISATTHNSPALPVGVGASDEAKYFYDAQTLVTGAPTFDRGYATGRLVATTYGGGSAGTYYGYDSLGRPLRSIQQMGGNNYQTSASYNLGGAVAALSYPSGRTVSYGYDGAGRATAFTGNLGDGVTRSYATQISYSPFGGITEERFGTTTPVFNKRHYNVRGQLYDIRVSTSSLSVDEWNWNRGVIVNWYDSTNGFPDANYNSGTDNNGNLLRQEVYVPNNDQASSFSFRRQNYTYDSLNRLTGVAEYANGTTQSFAQSYAYDRWGNRTIDITPTKSWGAGINNKSLGVNTTSNRLTVPGGQSGALAYDAVGNLVTDTYTGEGAREYDAENRISRAWANNQWQIYAYDSDGKRVKRVVNSTETWQVYGMGGELLAEYAQNGTAANPKKEYGYRNGELLVTLEGAASQTQTIGSTPNSATFVSQQVPATMTAGHRYAVSVTFRNSGSNTWTAANYYNLGSANDNGAWSLYRVALPAPVAPNQEVTFNFTITAPATPANYNFQWRVVQDYYEWFGDYSANVQVAVSGGPGNGGNAAECVWQNVPSAMIAGQSYTLSVKMLNTGSNTWTTANHYNLGSANDNGAWSLYRVAVPSSIAPGQESTFTFTVTAPATPGTYNFQWRMVQDYVEWFGDTSTNVAVSVSPPPSATMIRWLVTDQLGTPRIILDESGSLATVSRHDYLPFGEELFAGTGGRTTSQGYTASDNVRQKFTGYEHDTETGLEFAQARYYASQQGRFTSVDSGPFTPADPQNWNRYSYVQNSPLKFVDPTGLSLYLNGEDADQFLEFLRRKSGLSLERDEKTGKIKVAKGSKRNEDGTSKELSKLIKRIISGSERVGFIVKEDAGSNILVDDGRAGEKSHGAAGIIDFGDLRNADAQAPELATTLAGHVLYEGLRLATKQSNGLYNTFSGDPKFGLSDERAGAHCNALKYEAKIMSEFTGTTEELREGIVGRDSISFKYTSVQYDVLLKTQTPSNPNSVTFDKITKSVPKGKPTYKY
jgi:RHS repeat-associated protein